MRSLYIALIFFSTAIYFSACNLQKAVNENESSSYSDNDLIAIRDGFDERVEGVFNSYRGKPLKRTAIRPPISEGRPAFSKSYSFSLVTYATRCFWLRENIDSANLALIENAEYYLKNNRELFDKDNFHWHSEVVLRLVELYGQYGTKDPGLLKPETEKTVLEAIWLYCKRDGFREDYRRINDSDLRGHDHLSIADQDVSNTWFISESENHHAQSFTTQWHFSKLAKSRDDFKNRLYDDGYNASVHFARWNDYANIYLSERARKGMFIEMMSIGYNTDLLKGIFNFYDFADDEELKRKTGNFLDLYFTYWGQEQLNGISGGGKSRLYSDISVSTSGLGYFFFGVGNNPGLQQTLLTAMTTSYRPALVVIDIVCDRKGRGTYEVVQRPLGLVTDSGYFRPAQYRMRTDYGGILRYSYCTPDFILGTPMCESRPHYEWAMISSQNRSHGVIFENDQAASILPQCENFVNSRAFNSQWSVQKKGTLICQKLKTSRAAGKTRIWFSGKGLSDPQEENGWIFAESTGAFAAVKVVEGSYYWDTTLSKVPGKWLYCTEEYSPIILEVAVKNDYRSSSEFRSGIYRNKISYNNSILRYRGIYGDNFTFYADFSRSPLINNKSVNYAPPKAFDSPFLQSEWNSGIVYIQKGKRKLTLNFNDVQAPLNARQRDNTVSCINTEIIDPLKNNDLEINDNSQQKIISSAKQNGVKKLLTRNDEKEIDS